MLTAQSETDQRIRGLEAGVDDYIAKPFEPRELVLRLQNIHAPRTNAAPEATRLKVKMGELICSSANGANCGKQR